MKPLYWFIIILIFTNALAGFYILELKEQNEDLNSSLERFRIPYDDRRYLGVKYDRETVRLIEQLGEKANCIDVGAHKGAFTRHFIRSCPQGSHFAIEPLPHLHQLLEERYGDRVTVFPHAVSNEKGKAVFNYYPERAGLSGLKMRREDLEVKEIEVELELLDNLIPDSIKIDFIKIDVEGAEFQVMQGAKRIMLEDKPLIVFEYGYDSRELFGATPQLVFDFLQSTGYKVNSLEYYLRGKRGGFLRDEFIQQFVRAYNWYFIAYPG